MSAAARYLVGDVFDRMAELPDGSVDLVLTSPPFLCLRSYLPADHPDKAKEIGSEATPADYLDTLLALTAEWGRVLAPHGSICVELGDTFAGSGGAGGDYNPDGLRAGQPQFRQRTDGGRYPNGYSGNKTGHDVSGSNPGFDVRPVRSSKDGWPMDKSLCGIPDAYALSLEYGWNVLRRDAPDSPAGRWRARNKVAWVRPNPPVGALCVDDQTEVLTPDGWKRHDQLSDGDLIAVYDKGTDSCRFAPAKFVRWERENEPMISIEKRKTSQRLTEHHRCLVRTTKRPEPHVVLAGDLTNSHQTMLAAPFDDAGVVEPMSDARAELLGWFITEGSPVSRQALIRQSKSTNPGKVDRIRDLLIAEGADFRESDYRRSSGPYGGDILTTFAVKGELAAWLNLHHKRLPEQYVTSWPTTTLRALWRGLVDGDGHRRKAGGILFFQKDRQVVDAFQIIAIRLGYRCTITRSDAMDGWQATVGNPESFESSRWTKVRKWDGEGIPRETYTGIVWCPMVETSFWLARRDGRTFITGNSDKFRPATSYLTIACRARDRYFDLDAVRAPHARSPDSRALQGPTARTSADQEHRQYGVNIGGATGVNGFTNEGNPAGAPPLDWWNIPPAGTRAAHYAVFPEALCVRPILAMSPRRVCTVCGKPSRRIVGEATYIRNGQQVERNEWGSGIADGKAAHSHKPDGATTRVAPTTGWSSCGCPGADGLRLDGYHTGPGWRPGMVLDPFAGTGTTGAVAVGHGRDCTLIDLDSRNADLARDRIGMFLTIDPDIRQAAG